MSLFLIILAAGNSKRLKSNIPKPFHVTNNRTLLEHSFNAFKNFYPRDIALISLPEASVCLIFNQIKENSRISVNIIF